MDFLGLFLPPAPGPEARSDGPQGCLAPGLRASSAHHAESSTTVSNPLFLPNNQIIHNQPAKKHDQIPKPQEHQGIVENFVFHPVAAFGFLPDIDDIPAQLLCGKP
jgi:hypothetical protein